MCVSGGEEGDVVLGSLYRDDHEEEEKVSSNDVVRVPRLPKSYPSHSSIERPLTDVIRLSISGLCFSADWLSLAAGG